MEWPRSAPPGHFNRLSANRLRHVTRGQRRPSQRLPR